MGNNIEMLNQQIRHIGHEIRNSLSICDIYSEIIKKNLVKENIKNQSLENAVNCIQNAVQLIGNNLLELKSLGGVVLHVCDADKLLEQAVNMSKVYVGEKSISIEYNSISNGKIHVDENKFQACLINIIKNAIESIEKKGSVKISTRIDADKLIISVINDGKPIDDSDKTKIFEDGFTTKSTGSGIGLFLCKKYLNDMNCDIKLKSSDNHCTVFEITTKLFSF